MRIVGGAKKGTRLAYPSKGIRPTSKVVKQAVFNILRPKLAGAKVCDLYCGAGSLGIEALSGGASSVVFVERDQRTFMLLKENLAPWVGYVRTIAGDVLKVLPKLKAERFDVILADPPYEQGLDSRTLAAIARFNMLNPGGLIVLEDSRRDKPTVPAGLELVKSHDFGDTVVSVIRKKL